MGHYYSQLDDGVVIPRHFVKNLKQSKEQGAEVLRPTRITDVRKWWKEGQNVAPSVTTVMDVLAKHALVNWKIDQHLQVAWSHYERLEPLLGDDEKYIKEVKRITEANMDVAPSAGTDFHGLMEAHVKGELQEDQKDWVLCHKVVMAIGEKIENYDSHKWQTELNFVSGLGYGGQVDLHPSGWIIDYKTKQLAEKFKPGKMAYDDHRTQLAAYREGIGQPKARCANVFVCLEDGQIDFHEHKEEDLQKGWSIFQHALAIWNLQAGKSWPHLNP